MPSVHSWSGSFNTVFWSFESNFGGDGRARERPVHQLSKLLK